MFWKNLPVFLVVFFLISSFFPIPTEATAPQMLTIPTGTIGLNDPFTISATMSGLSKNATYRLRVAIAQSGTSNYFGSTYNGSNWYNGTPSPINYADFLSILTDGNGAWWGSIQGKIDPDDPNFTTGSGTYDLKVGRYTQTGSTATWSDPGSITISVPPQPTDTPIPPTSTPTPIVPTPTHIIFASTPTSSIKIVNTPTIIFSPTNESSFGAVLGSMSADSPTIENKPTLVAAEADHRETKVDILPLIFILVGFSLLASCGILIAAHTEKGKMLWKKFF